MKKLFLAPLIAVATLLLTSGVFASSSVVYDALPSVSPATNYPSLGYQATQTAEFGDYIHLGGTSRVLNTVTVTMSDWALYSDYASDARYSGNSEYWTHPITLNVYGAHLDVNGVPDDLLATITQNISIPWRPEGDPTCPDTGYGAGFAWRNSANECVNGLAFNATFDLSGLNVTLPDDIIIGIAFNTQSYGEAPMVDSGPYNSLNVAVPDNQSVAVGSDNDVDGVFWNTSTGAYYSNPGPAGVFRQDTNWAPNGTIALQVTASEPLVGPPTSKDDCKNGGWQSFNNPSFKNQGDCVSYVATGGRH